MNVYQGLTGIFHDFRLLLKVVADPDPSSKGKIKEAKGT